MEKINEKLRTCVVLAAGDFPSNENPLALLEKYRNEIICCDGATDELLAHGFVPEAAVGDGDSISPFALDRLKDRFIKQSEQETNDLTKAVKYAVSHGYRHIYILGATGKREDHTIGNVALLVDYMDFVRVEMLTDYGRFIPITGKKRINSRAGQHVSFFCMDSSPLTVEGVRWKVDKMTVSRWWQATLNEVVSDEIVVETDGKAVIFLEYLK